ncbi:hypothetical protein PT015_17405 [Candidatus Mycobacterium wuenschmannii]|uniref:Uncharacterized protein n=1 Tax=Candidatus Mycobacterium wuenschmannii TaxID=3027808 RepID=A0ABY8VTJ8_9MYCO|nr:hypothetical protein [Candidatus Mycobacterium wuenschmannii]WIM86656.1 hypothetical protein PT015_17405 [Candidatus Mycobacterium wuenschmannii]
MSEKREQYLRAYQDGLDAEIGATNPYAGTGGCAKLWRLGYKRMLEKKVKGTRAMLRYQAARDGMAARAPWN